MQCPCGGLVTETNHPIITKQILRQWAVNAVIVETRQPPAIIEQHRCRACGRQHHNIRRGVF